MKKLLVFFALLFSHLLPAQVQPYLAIINDPDGFTFIRSGAGKNFPVTDTIRKDEFFYCYGDTSLQWINVQEAIHGKTGYMHRSRVLFFSQLDSVKQHSMILDAFSEIVAATNAYYGSDKPFGSKEKTVLTKKRDDIYEGKYLPAYYAFEKLFCAKPDSVLLVEFFKTLPWMTNSADEGKDWTSAKCWVTHPQFVDNIVCHWKNESERKTVISSIENGMALSDLEKGYSPAQLKKMYTELEKKCN